MPFLYRKSAGDFGDPVKNVYHKVGGVWRPLVNAYQHVGGLWKQVFQAEIVVTISADVTSLNIQSLFTSDEWAAVKPKRVIIQAGVVIQPAGTPYAIRLQDPVLLVPWGGTLTIDNYGTLQGNGGAANSGVGGSVFYSGSYPYGTFKKAIINNFGIIRAGGGGGGRGGNGGGGYYNYTATEGPSFGGYPAGSGSRTWWQTTSGTNFNSGWWGNTLVFSGGDSSPKTVGAYTYSRGTSQASDTSGGTTITYYTITRSYSATAYTSGGTFGNGGRGQGADGANASGSAGSAGGTNAGTGGTGGSGGTWGNTGGTGNSGANGNYSSGGGGLTGGLAGITYTAGFHTMNNTGTLQGRVG